MFQFRQKAKTEISRQAMEACEQIIAEMGAELHDDLIQKLSIFRLYMDRLERSVNDPKECETLLIKMRADFQEVVQSVRKISRQLMPVRMDDDSFQKGIEMLCQNMERANTEHIHFEFTGTEQKIPALGETYLYRVIQELIHNAFKHSSAWHIWVRLQWSTGKLVIEVEDDGTGFHKINEFIERLRKKHNTLKMRTQVIGASISYRHGQKGLLARIEYTF
jgi:two-component system sensor histidine kinase DegS